MPLAIIVCMELADTPNQIWDLVLEINKLT
jgi:hypothetical protein